jgi:hypothetical protein
MITQEALFAVLLALSVFIVGIAAVAVVSRTAWRCDPRGGQSGIRDRGRH